jgi:hypothetical protein
MAGGGLGQSDPAQGCRNAAELCDLGKQPDLCEVEIAEMHVLHSISASDSECTRRFSQVVRMFLATRRIWDRAAHEYRDEQPVHPAKEAAFIAMKPE